MMRLEKLKVEGLCVEAFDQAVGKRRRIFSGVRFSITSGQGLGITGESAAGKTTLALALGGLLPDGMQASAQMFQWALQQSGRTAGRHIRVEAQGQLKRHLARLRGRATFCLFQEPRASLNPYRSIGQQLSRCAKQGSRNNTGQKNKPSTAAALRTVGLDPEIERCYPHELSTGMCQRVLFAMSSLLGTCVLIADEPFASVDVATRTHLTELLRARMRQAGLALILVSHDLDLLEQLTDQTMVMYRGTVAEIGPSDLLLRPGTRVHPYTWLLRESARGQEPPLAGDEIQESGDACCWYSRRCPWAEVAVCSEPVPEFRIAQSVSESNQPRPVAIAHQVRCVKHPIAGTAGLGDLSGPNRRPGNSARDQDHLGQGSWDPGLLPDEGNPNAVGSTGSEGILRVVDLGAEYRTGWFGTHVQTVFQEVQLNISQGERLGLVGPSGQGKTTLARVIAGLLRPASGSVHVRQGGRWIDLGQMSSGQSSALRRTVQLVYQDAELILDPADKVGEELTRAYQVFDPRLDRDHCYGLASNLLAEIGLEPELLQAYPYRLSGGERKRVAMARCFAALGFPFCPGPEQPARLVILDEPTSGLDGVLQIVLCRFLLGAQRHLRLSYLVISHDERFVEGFCHQVYRLGSGLPLEPAGCAARLEV